MTDMPLDTEIADPPADGIRSTPFRRRVAAWHQRPGPAADRCGGVKIFRPADESLTVQADGQ
jgi:hypothetical protein